MSRQIEKWRDERGSIDFIQLVTGLLIVAIAAVGTFQALAFGYDHLNQEMRYRKAMALGRAYVEYWQGRIHSESDWQNAENLAGNLGRPRRMLLDPGDPMTITDDLYCEVSYGPLVGVDQPTTGRGVDYWVIRVYVKWWERWQIKRDIPYEVSFYGTMVPAAL